MKKYSIPFVVFMTGACVLVIEVVAIRIISPYFGNTIFTVSSVISVVLAALSVGYYFGGKYADKYPQEKIFYTIILLSGFSVAFLQLLNLQALPMLGYNLSIITGPLVSSVILFFLPSLLLGTLSPFAIKLQGQRYPKKGVGSITGEIFFWSTLGSIFGSLSSGFILIPMFGINTIILAVAVILCAIGIIPLTKKGNWKNSTFILTLLITIGIILLNAFTPTRKNLVFSKDGTYEKITIYDGVFNKKAARFFWQDRSLSGVMYLDSDELAADYTKYYALYQVFKPDVKQALVLGGGAYSVPKALLAELPDVQVDISEIEPSLFEIAKKYLKVPESDRLHNYTDDGRRLLHDTNKKYDLIFSDVFYSLLSIPAHFTTQEFFKIAQTKLSDEGVIIVNFIGILSEEEPSLLMSEINTFRSVFSNSYYFAVFSPTFSKLQNVIMVGYNSDKKMNVQDPKYLTYKNPIIQSMGKKSINLDIYRISQFPILTDNYSPVEYFTASLLQKDVVQKTLADEVR
jgi:spermidine synthase